MNVIGLAFPLTPEGICLRFHRIRIRFVGPLRFLWCDDCQVIRS
jgi:hypothetical protein